MNWRERAPGPFSLWARFAPRAWPPSPGLHVDPFTGSVAAGSSAPRAKEEEAIPAEPPGEPEVVYLPPVAPERAEERDELAAKIAAAGGHPLVHRYVGETESARHGTVVVDLLDPLLEEVDPEALAFPRGAWVVVPLVAGLFDGEAHLGRWLDRISRLRAGAAVGLAIALEPVERRRLAEVAGEERWEAIFHGAALTEREFARAAAAYGVVTLPPRPEIALPPRGARNRDLAGALAMAGELSLRLGRSEAEGESLLAAARRVASDTLDFSALARERNLQVVDWLSPRARRLIEEWVAGRESDLSALLREWNGETAGGAAP